MAYKRVWLISSLLLVLALIFILWPSGYTLELIPEGNTSEPVVRFNVVPGDRLMIKYIHSWDKTPVTEIYEIQKDNTLMLLSTEYSWLGTGLEFNPPQGTLSFSEKGSTVISGINRKIKTLYLKVGWIAQHQLIIGDKIILLSDFIIPGETVSIRVEKTLITK